MMTQIADFLDYERKRNAKATEIQEKVFINWCNLYLKPKGLPIRNLLELQDGNHLLLLLKTLAAKNFELHSVDSAGKEPSRNWEIIINFLENENIHILKSPDHLKDTKGTVRMLASILWLIILRYQIIEDVPDDGILDTTDLDKARSRLLEWVQSIIPGYPVRNFSSNWTNGVALCHLVNGIHPGAIPVNSLSGDASNTRLRLACKTAERELGIPQIIYPEDISHATAEEKSMMTYISLYRNVYRKLKEREEMENSAVPNEMNVKHDINQTNSLANDVSCRRQRCVVFGLGIRYGQVGIPAEFMIKLYDPTVTQLSISIQCHPFSGEKAKCNPELKIKYIDVDTYAVRYTPTRQGKYVLSIYCDEEHIHKSPFRFNIKERLLENYYQRGKLMIDIDANGGPFVNPLPLKRHHSYNSIESKESSRQDSAFFDDDLNSLTSSSSRTPYLLNGGSCSLYEKLVKFLKYDDFSKIYAFGSGLTQVEVGKIGIFNIFTPNENKGPLYFCIECPALSIPAPSIRTKIYASHSIHSIIYLPTEPGIYKIALKWGREVITGSPFYILVEER